MDIGKEKEKITIEPVKSPVPSKPPAPAQPTPIKEPVKR